MVSPAEDSIPTRQSLLLRLKEWDDATSWREFFETYWELIYNVARRAGLNDAAAQDVVQETVIAVARKIGEFDTDPGRGSFKSWLLGQARWRIGDQFRARKRHGNMFADTSNTAVGAPGQSDDSRTEPLQRVADAGVHKLETLWDEEWERHVLRRAMEQVKSQVSIKQLQIFDLHVRQGLSVAETARALGTTVAATYMAKSRVGRLVRKEIERIRIDER